MSDYVMMSDILYVTAVRGTVPKSEVEIEMAEEVGPPVSAWCYVR